MSSIVETFVSDLKSEKNEEIPKSCVDVNLNCLIMPTIVDYQYSDINKKLRWKDVSKDKFSLLKSVMEEKEKIINNRHIQRA